MKLTEAYSNYIEISSCNFYRNIRTIQKIIGANTKICIVIKSNAYGHGINNLIHQINNVNPDYIGAVYNNEIITTFNKIGKHNKIKIIRLAPGTPIEVENLIEHHIHIEEVTGSYEHAIVLSKLAQKYNTVLNVHLYINTGMYRMGAQEIEGLAKIFSLPALNIVGVMTHFAKAHMSDGSDYLSTKEQLNLFFDKIKTLKTYNKSLIMHAANSASTIKFKWTHLDMVRVGDCLYGADIEDLDKSQQFLQVFKSFKSSVAMIINNIPANTPIGYDGAYVTKPFSLSRTATIRVGFDHGLPKDSHSRKIEVLIRGKRYPVIGNVSMSMAIVDISKQSLNQPIQIGDEVVIIGIQGDEEITLKEFANKLSKSISEVVLQIGNQSLYSYTVD